MSFRVLIGEDHALTLRGIRQILESRYQVVGAASNGRELVELALRLKPSLVVLDLSMPELNGIEAAKQIQAALPKTKLLFLSMHSNPIYLRKAIEAGASGYVLKAGAADELMEAVRAVQAGKTWFSPGFGDQIAEATPIHRRPSNRRAEELTDRQREILQLIAEGRANKEIAYRLNISAKTVDFHRARMMARLGVHSTGALVRRAVEEALIPAATMKIDF
jgi:DNA-binding NarL/FixJ family response regulator